MSNYLEEQILTHIFRNSSYSKPSEIAVALCTSTPLDSNTGVTIEEVPNSNSYARVNLDTSDSNWSAITSGSTNNSLSIIFPQASGNWGVITSMAILDSSTWGEGNVLFYGDLNEQVEINNNNIFAIDVNTLIITLN